MKLTPLGKLLLFVVGLGLVLVAVGRFLPPELRSWDGLLGRGGGIVAGQAAAPRGDPPPAGGTAEVILRLHGSNTIGKDLAPALAERYLAGLGATSPRRVATGEEALRVEATLTGHRESVAIEIEARGSATAFEDLAAGEADVGMASRRVKPDERARLAALGDLTAPASEHVLGLDGLAILVPASSPVDGLTLDQLRDVFTGRVGDWSALGGPAGAIHLYARDDKSGTYDTFRTLVLRDASLGDARRYEDSRALAHDVAADPGGIGFAGLAFVGDCRALKISEAGAVAYRPTVFTVRTEDYALSRRLYLYTAASPANPHVARFVAFALSNEGQAIVDALGFVGQALDRTVAAAPETRDVPPEYSRLSRGAERLPLNFRFESGSDRLDNKALRDVGRLLENLSLPANRSRQVLLFGFADALGGAEGNLRLSESRARAVALELRAEGVRAEVVIGFGSALPVAANDTEPGRARNRRVEVWLR